MSTKHYVGIDIVVSFDPARCMHAGECVRGLPRVFDAGARPWIRPEGAPAGQIADIVQRCPSGALRAHWADGSDAEAVPVRNSATVTADGPLLLHGQIEIRDDEGKLVAAQTRMALCRCGASRNKPHCDGSHVGAGFHDAGCFAPACEPSCAQRPLVLRLVHNGPVQASGPLTIACADGSVGYRGEKCWLCRCGASRNKPYCDGSHVKSGFVG